VRENSTTSTACDIRCIKNPEQQGH
jgi:hypothetical protein